MHTAFQLLPSPVPRFIIHFNLQSVHQFVEAAEKIDHSHDFEYRFVIEPQLPHRGNVDRESVVASHYGRHGYGYDLLGQTVKLAGFVHNGLDLIPI